jgi:hypothetical protein
MFVVETITEPIDMKPGSRVAIKNEEMNPDKIIRDVIEAKRGRMFISSKLARAVSLAF